MESNTVSKIWLDYFNQYLFDKGVITEAERNKMITLIQRKCHAPNKIEYDKQIK